MAMTVALFGELNPLDEARAALQHAGYGENVQRVLDRTTLDDTGQSTPAAGATHDGTLLSFGRAAPGSATGPLGGLGLSDEEAEFLRRSIDDGAQVLAVETEGARDAAEVEEVLRPYAQRVIRSE